MRTQQVPSDAGDVRNPTPREGSLLRRQHGFTLSLPKRQPANRPQVRSDRADG